MNLVSNKDKVTGTEYLPCLNDAVKIIPTFHKSDNISSLK